MTHYVRLRGRLQPIDEPQVRSMGICLDANRGKKPPRGVWGR